MYQQLLANIKTNFKFYRRNRLLLVAAILIVVVLGLSSLPMMFFLTKTKYLFIIKTIFSELSGFATIITAGLGLLFISHHIRNRSTKMVFTKPCSPEMWLFSGFLSAVIVSLILYMMIFIVCSILFWAWDVPFQWGMLYVTVNDFLQAVVILSYISLLAVLFHPVVVVLFIFIFNESAFYSIKVFLIGGIKAAGESSIVPLLKVIKGFIDIAYMIVPTFSPYSGKTGTVYSSFRTSTQDWGYLLLSFTYILFASALFYLLSVYFLKKKRHI